MSSSLATRRFGSSDILVTPLCVGCAPLGSMPDTFGYGVSVEQALDTLRAVFSSPINYIDTAASYGDGESERRIGLMLRELGGLPEGYVLGTKVDRDAKTGDFSGEHYRTIGYVHIIRPRNLTDDMLKALAKNGGVVQLNLLSDYVKTIPPSAEREAAMKALYTKYNIKDRRGMATLPEAEQQKARADFMELNKKYPVQLATVKDAIDHIDHMVKLIGIDHVGMGADFDGGGALADCFDVSQYENMTIELVRRGYSKKDIEKIWSGNFFRVMKAVEKGKTGEVSLK